MPCECIDPRKKLQVLISRCPRERGRRVEKEPGMSLDAIVIGGDSS